MRWTALTILSALVLFAAWRIVSLMRADAALQNDDAAVALQWRPNDGRALLMQAEAQLAANDASSAASTARRILQVNPIDGRAYRVLAQVSEKQGDQTGARMLYSIAVRRAPKDLPTRAWLAQDALQRGDYPSALDHIDRVLTFSSGAAGSMLPILVKLAADDAFADALAQKLRSRPTWRGGMLAALRAPSTGDATVNDRVLGALQRNGGLDATETTAWLDSLMQQGRWGEAYARWAGPLIAAGVRLPLLYNGDFAQDPDAAGFNWRQKAVAGLIFDLEPASASLDGRSAHLRFLGRRVSGTLLAHPLLLPPGRYRLAWRERTDAFRADTGVEWRISCEGSPEVVARSQPMVGTYAWQARSLDFDIRPAQCSGQWLQLSPTGGANAGQVMSGDLWLSGVKLERGP